MGNALTEEDQQRKAVINEFCRCDTPEQVLEVLQRHHKSVPDERSKWTQEDYRKDDWNQFLQYFANKTNRANRQSARTESKPLPNVHSTSFTAGALCKAIHWTDTELDQVIKYLDQTIDFLEGRGDAAIVICTLRIELNRFKDMKDARKKH